MRPVTFISFAAAAIVHLLLLFAFRAGTAARPLPLEADASPVDVALVEAPPAVVEQPPEPAPTPEPQPTPEPPAPAPTPEAPMPTPEPEPMMTKATPPPEGSKPKPKEKPKPFPTAVPLGPKKTAPVTNATRTPAAAPQGPVSTARPRDRSNPKPEYPPEARRLRQEGVVVVSAQVGADGRAVSVTLERSSGIPALDQAALQAVRRWSFEPARAGGVSVSSRVEVPVRFSLSGS